MKQDGLEGLTTIPCSLPAMFALKKTPGAKASTANLQVAYTAGTMFLYFALLRAAPYVIARFRS